MEGPPSERPRGSTAPAAFDAARRLLAGTAFGSVHARAGVDFLPPYLASGPAPPRPDAGVPGATPVGTHDGGTRGGGDLSSGEGAGGQGAGGEGDHGPLHRTRADLACGRTSARAVTQAALDAVAARNGELRALAEVAAEQALAEADACDRDAAAGHWRGPLHGVPITVKDVIDVAGLPTRAGSDAYHDRPRHDAAAVALLRRAGAIVLGKATTHEFALGVTSPQSRNPHDPGRIPGGSSGGSAIAVATGMGLASLGTDTRASIRVPAALSGVVGFKATYGRVPTAGVLSLSWTMDHVAPMAVTVADAALVLDVLDPRGAGGRPFAAAIGAPVDALRIGIPEAAFAGCEPGVAKTVARAVEAASELGCVVENVDRPDAADLGLANAAGLIVSRCEAAAAHRGYDLDRNRYWQEVAEQLALADELSAVDYLTAQRARLQLGRELLGVFEACDVLAMPTAPVVAPPVDDFAAHLMTLARNAIPWSFVGFPALSLPCGQVQGLPVGLQLVAAPWREDHLVRLGSALERSLSLGGSRPPAAALPTAGPRRAGRM